MGNILHTGQHHSVRTFSRDPHSDLTPLFLRTDYNKIRTIEQASLPFLSLVDFIKEGNNLDDKATIQACTLLKRTIAHFTNIQILYNLVPKPDGSCFGFAESIVPLLTSSNEVLVKASMSLLERIAFHGFPAIHFDFLATDFFHLLPQAFYEQDMHLIAHSNLVMMTIVTRFVMDSHPHTIQKLCQSRQISMDTFEQTFIDKFIRHIAPFLEFITTHRRRIKDSVNSWDFPELFGTILEFAPFLEQMTQFVLSSSLSLTILDCSVFFETSSITYTFIRRISDGIAPLLKNDPAVKKRGRQIQTKLCAEGLSDEIELHLKYRSDSRYEHHILLLVAKLIAQLGGNVQFFA